MAQIEKMNLSKGELAVDRSKEFLWPVEFDEHLEVLLEAQGIVDPDIQCVVCDALCALGLADREIYAEHTEVLESQATHYASTKAMRWRVKEWLCSTKHW